MSKKKRRKEEREGGKTPGRDVPDASASVEGAPISSTGKKTIASGAVLAVVGFAVLTQADSLGRNWAASLSPFLILGGYALIGWGILRDDAPPAAKGPASPAAPAAVGGGPLPSLSPSVPPEKTT